MMESYGERQSRERTSGPENFVALKIIFNFEVGLFWRYFPWKIVREFAQNCFLPKQTILPVFPFLIKRMEASKIYRRNWKIQYLQRQISFTSEKSFLFFPPENAWKIPNLKFLAQRGSFKFYSIWFVKSSFLWSMRLDSNCLLQTRYLISLLSSFS